MRKLYITAIESSEETEIRTFYTLEEQKVAARDYILNEVSHYSGHSLDEVPADGFEAYIWWRDIISVGDFLIFKTVEIDEELLEKPKTRFTFDVKLFSVITVEANCQTEAEQILRDCLDKHDANFGVFPDGVPIISHVCLDDELPVIEIDGVPV